MALPFFRPERPTPPPAFVDRWNDGFDVLVAYGGAEFPPLVAVPEPERNAWQRYIDRLRNYFAPATEAPQLRLVPAQVAPSKSPSKSHLFLVSDDPFTSDAQALLIAENRRTIARAHISAGNAMLRDALRMIEHDANPGDLSAQLADAQDNAAQLRRIARRRQ